jgi:hypothetical protein
MNKVNLSPIESIEQVRLFMERLYNRYREEFGYHQISLFLSENATYHILRIHRILTFTQWFFQINLSIRFFFSSLLNRKI